MLPAEGFSLSLAPALVRRKITKYERGVKNTLARNVSFLFDIEEWKRTEEETPFLPGDSSVLFNAIYGSLGPCKLHVWKHQAWC